MLRIIMYPLCNSREVDGKVGVESGGAAFGGSFLDAKHQVPTRLSAIYSLLAPEGRNQDDFQTPVLLTSNTNLFSRPSLTSAVVNLKISDKQKCCLSASKFNERI
jgi:hypothetical protein